MAGGSGGPLKLDGRNYAYWKARMAGYLEAINPIAWAVTEKPIVGPWNEDQVKYGARAKNALFDALSEEIFARVQFLHVHLLPCLLITSLNSMKIISC